MNIEDKIDEERNRLVAQNISSKIFKLFRSVSHKIGLHEVEGGQKEEKGSG